MPRSILLFSPVLFLATAWADVPSGRWVKTTSPEHTQAEIDRAVDEAAQGVSWMYRGIARPKLAEQAVACPAYRFSGEGERFKVQCEGRDPFEWTVGERGTFTDDKGQELTAELQRRDASTYELVIEAPKGGKRWRYIFGEQGALRVEQEVFSEHLDAPMRWSLDYALPN